MTAINRRLRRLFATAAGAILLATLPVSASAQGPDKGEVAAKQADLRELRAKIDELRKEISSAEGSRAEITDQLKDSERAISQLQRELRELGDEKAQQQAALRELRQQSQTLEAQLATQQTQLERLLYSQYLRGSPGSLQLLLNGDDPSQLARDLHYLGAIARARSDMLAEIDATLRKKQALADSTRERASALAAVEAKQKERHDKLLAQREQKKTTLSKISQQIAAQKKEVGSLRRDERRMTQLIDRLSTLIAKRAKAARESSRRSQEKPAPRGAPALDNDKLPQALSGNFARLRGKLRLPVQGSVANRFGANRQEGSTWKGLFIRSGAGSEVKAIAAGHVVFAEWMRGFGNLLIVDHGDAYLSIYGNNEALLKNVGDAVNGGDTVATVGNSGGNPETGLYFEIRHQGQPVDPLKWASLK